MKHHLHHTVPVLAAAGMAAALLFNTAPAQARTSTSCPTLGLPSAVEQHVAAEASAGVDALRRYISITEAVYQLNMDEVAQWLDARRQATGCPST